LLTVCAVAAIFSFTASATPSGTLNIGSGGTATASLTDLVFNPDPNVPGFNGEVASNTTLLFAGGPLTIGEGILINNGNPVTFASIGNPTFFQFQNHSNLVFSADGFGPGVANTNCAGLSVGQSCSVFAGSPLILTLSSTTTSTATFGVNGHASDTGTAGLLTGSLYNGTFTNSLTQLLANGLAPTPGNIQAYLCPSGACAAGLLPTAGDVGLARSVTSPFGGQFQASVVPEPATMSMMGFGLIAASYLLRRRNRK